MSERLLDVENLSVGFVSKAGLTTAVQDVSFRVDKGEIVCLVGESGSGKTVTSLSIMRLIAQDSGRIHNGSITFDDRDVITMANDEVQKLRGKQISMIFQEPMTAMDPVFTIGHQITEVLMRHESMTKGMARHRTVSLLKRVGIPDPDMRFHQYPHELSGGMRQRAMIAMALACNPKLLIADEPTTALDVTIQAQILNLLRELQSEFNMSILLITHDLGIAAEMSDRVVVMYAGKVVEQAVAAHLFQQPYHPYTMGLMKSVPTMDGERRTVLHSIKGSIPSLNDLPSGCRFHPRCPYATDRCAVEEPPLTVVDGREVACWQVGEILQTVGDAQNNEVQPDSHQVKISTAATVTAADSLAGISTAVTATAHSSTAVTSPAAAATTTSSGSEVRATSLHLVRGALDRIGQEENYQGPLLEVNRLVKHFPVKKGILNRTVAHVQAVDDVSFSVHSGETFGIVGESGCGKTTLGRVVLRLQHPTAGTVHFQGRNLQDLKSNEMREMRRQMQIVFQDPYGSLDPRWTVEQIIGEPLRVHEGMHGKERADRVAELLDWVGLSPSSQKRFVHEFSGGQRQRIGIARAIALNPKFIVCDEAVSALDVSVQSQVLNLLMGLQERLGLTYLFIAHGLNVVRHISDRIAVMYLGKIVEVADADELFRHPSHPYTRALLSVIPIPDPTRQRQKVVLEGEIPSPSNPPTGCRFRTRCPLATEKCAVEEPLLNERSNGHSVACHYA